MRIGIIAPPWIPVPPPDYGGTETVVHELAVGLARAGHDVSLFTTGDATCPVPRQAIWPTAEKVGMGNPFRELRHVVHAYDALRDRDIIHDHTTIGPVYADRVPGPPVVTTVHSPVDQELGDVYGPLGSRVAVIGISAAQFETSFGIRVAAVIRHGVDPVRFPVGEGRGGYCVFVGRMSPDKGAHRAIAVAEKTRVPLVVAGKIVTPEERAYFEREVQPHRSDRVHCLPNIEHRRKLDILAKASCLLFPIRWNEPFGIVMLEAMACGTPVLAFREGAAPEVVRHGETGFLCDDEDEMACLLRQVPQLDRQKCRAAVEGDFSADRMVADHCELYARIVDRHDPAVHTARRIFPGRPSLGRRGPVRNRA